MRIETLPGTQNVVRFPIEFRAPPTMELVRELAPDAREVLAMVESHELQPVNHDLRDAVDAETAEYILNHVPTGHPEREACLRAMLERVTTSAVSACRQLQEGNHVAAGVRRLMAERRRAGSAEVDALLERHERLVRLSTERTLIAHTRVEEAEGVARAVGYALRNQPWAPRDHEAETDELIGFGEWMRCQPGR